MPNRSATPGRYQTCDAKVSNRAISVQKPSYRLHSKFSHSKFAQFIQTNFAIGDTFSGVSKGRVKVDSEYKQAPLLDTFLKLR